MKFPRRQFLHLATGAAALALVGAPATSQNFPTRTITLVVPFVAGGTTDAAARIVGEHMATILGQHVVVENVSGGGSLIGTGRVARAPPDGYTLLVHQMAIAANVSLFPKAPFNVEKDLTGVGLINYGAQMIVGRKTLAQNSVAELTAWMKQPGGHAKFGHSGPGSSPHICAVMFAAAIGAEIELIPYRGGAPAMSDLISGHLDLFCTNLAGEHVKAGTVKAYGVLSKQRLSTFPDVPSLVQLGYPILDIRVWQGMFAPSATPTPILEKLNAALRVALADPKVVKRFQQTDFFVFPSDEQTIPAANALLHDEIVRWGQVIRANNIEGAP